jgi:hypothetical protein
MLIPIRGRPASSSLYFNFSSSLLCVCSGQQYPSQYQARTLNVGLPRDQRVYLEKQVGHIWEPGHGSLTGSARVDTRYEVLPSSRSGTVTTVQPSVTIPYVAFVSATPLMLHMDRFAARNLKAIVFVESYLIELPSSLLHHDFCTGTSST